MINSAAVVRQSRVGYTMVGQVFVPIVSGETCCVGRPRLPRLDYPQMSDVTPVAPARDIFVIVLTLLCNQPDKQQAACKV